MNMQVGQVIDGNKWELTQLISGQAKAPERSLRAIFEGIVECLEDNSKTINNSLKEKVWNSVSTERLTLLKEAFLKVFCERIFGKMDNNMIKEMLEEHKQNGCIMNNFYSQQIKVACYFEKEFVLNAVAFEADSMADEFATEVIEAFKNEGIVVFKK